jgi:hypothetical protein
MYPTKWHSFHEAEHGPLRRLTAIRAISSMGRRLDCRNFRSRFLGARDLQVDTVKAYLLAVERNLYLTLRRVVPIDSIPEPTQPIPSPERTAAGRQALSNALRAVKNCRISNATR